MPNLNSQWICNPKRSELNRSWQPDVESIFKTAKEIDSKGMRIKDSELITKSLIERIHKSGFPLDVWVIDEPKRAKQVLDLGADTITTNRFAWMKEKLEALDE